MGEVWVRQTFPGSVHEAERCWCDADGWPRWIDGLARVVEVSADWPREGSRVIWESAPAGRGRVSEQVHEYVPLERLVVFVEDSTMEGLQQVSFEPASDGVDVELRLEYKIKRRSPLTPLIDRLFVRRLMVASLAKTIDRFGTALAASRRWSVG
jgi:hypothetical protein